MLKKLMLSIAGLSIILTIMFLVNENMNMISKRNKTEFVNVEEEWRKLIARDEEIQNIVLNHRVSGGTINEIFGLELHIEKAMGNEVALGIWEINKVKNTDNIYLAKLNYYINGVKMYKSALINLEEKIVAEQDFCRY
jgi:hypothetical protein